ncbi:hypothetical protein MMC28_005790 [Mycoblastus sanguinarius]|nr:hypothetical protein [Mycoblastus sanguinarius]
MSLTLSHSLRTPLRRTIPLTLRSLLLTPTRLYATGTSDWTGREPHEHVTNCKDELNIQSSASQSGKKARASDQENQSQATSEKDSGNQNEQAKKDHPEAPGPVIGMNDERGGMGHKG